MTETTNAILSEPAVAIAAVGGLLALGAWLGWLKGLKPKIDKIEGIEKDITQVKTDIWLAQDCRGDVQDDIKELFSDAPPNFVADGRPPTVLRR